MAVGKLLRKHKTSKHLILWFWTPRGVIKKVITRNVLWKPTVKERK